MKARVIVLAALIILLLAGSAALAQPEKQAQPTWYMVERGITSGGGYHLLGLAWQVNGAASGGKYHLLNPLSPAGSENGCCCTFLPCVLRSP